MKIVALYARVSSRKQALGNTIASQIAELKDRISNDGHELLDGHEFKDDGRSGSNLEREGLDRLRDEVAEGKIDKIYVHSPDRLSRKSAYQALLLEEFKKAGSKVVFLNHQFDDNPESNLLLQVQGVIAEYERAKIMERNRRGKLHAARKGSVSVMGNAPYGYRYIKRNEIGGEGKFEINEEEAEVIRKLFMWIGEERVSIREAVRRFKEMSIMTQTGQKVWCRSTIHKMLKNPAYTGQAAFGKTKVGSVRQEVKVAWKVRKKSYSVYRTDKENWIYIKIPSIINEDLFNTVQEQLAENRKRARVQRGKGTYLLQKLVVCQHCEHAYCGMSCGSEKRRGVHRYYRCTTTNASRYNGKICNNKSVRTDILEIAVWEEVKSLLKKPEEYITKEEFEPRVKEMRQRLQEIEEQKERMLDKKKLQQELNLVISSLKNFSANIESTLDQVDWQTKQSIIRDLVKQVEISLDNVEIVWRIKELANPSQERRNQNMQHCRRIPVSRTGMTPLVDT